MTADMIWSLADSVRREKAEAAQRAADWQKAVTRLEVEFEATHGGGYPVCLKNLTPDQRVDALRDLGFRVRSKRTLDLSIPGQPPHYVLWADFTGGISMCLEDGFVVKRGGHG